MSRIRIACWRHSPTPSSTRSPRAIPSSWPVWRDERFLHDGTSRQLNRATAMKQAAFRRAGNRNMMFPAIVGYPFFTRSELSNGVQLADLPACSVYRAFMDEVLGYPYFESGLANFYRRRQGTAVDGLKVWPDRSPLCAPATGAWDSCQ